MNDSNDTIVTPIENTSIRLILDRPPLAYSLPPLERAGTIENTASHYSEDDLEFQVLRFISSLGNGTVYTHAYLQQQSLLSAETKDVPQVLLLHGRYCNNHSYAEYEQEIKKTAFYTAFMNSAALSTSSSSSSRSFGIIIPLLHNDVWNAAVLFCRPGRRSIYCYYANEMFGRISSVPLSHFTETYNLSLENVARTFFNEDVDIHVVSVCLFPRDGVDGGSAETAANSGICCAQTIVHMTRWARTVRPNPFESKKSGISATFYQDLRRDFKECLLSAHRAASAYYAAAAELLAVNMSRSSHSAASQNLIVGIVASFPPLGHEIILSKRVSTGMSRRNSPSNSGSPSPRGRVRPRPVFSGGSDRARRSPRSTSEQMEDRLRFLQQYNLRYEQKQTQLLAQQQHHQQLSEQSYEVLVVRGTGPENRTHDLKMASRLEKIERRIRRSRRQEERVKRSLERARRYKHSSPAHDKMTQELERCIQLLDLSDR